MLRREFLVNAGVLGVAPAVASAKSITDQTAPPTFPFIRLWRKDWFDAIEEELKKNIKDNPRVRSSFKVLLTSESISPEYNHFDSNKTPCGLVAQYIDIQVSCRKQWFTITFSYLEDTKQQSSLRVILSGTGTNVRDEIGIVHPASLPDTAKDWAKLVRKMVAEQTPKYETAKNERIRNDLLMTQEQLKQRIKDADGLLKWAQEKLAENHQQLANLQ